MNFSRPGAIDLSALSQQAARSNPPAPDGASWIVDADDRSIQQLAVESSLQHLVVLALWSPRSQQSIEFVGRLGAVVNSYAGQFLLVKVDVDAYPGVAQALGAQAVPTVVGFVKGQPIPLFQSAVADAEVRAYLDQLATVGTQNGVTGRAAPVGGVSEEPVEEVDDPRFAAADAAFAAGDLDAAVAEYESLVAQHPGDDEIKERLAGTQLIRRTQDVDLQTARKAAADRPDDIDAQLLMADLDVSGGHVQDAFDRLIDVVRRVAGDDRERVRQRLLDLFIVVGTADERVASARRVLATALY